MNNKLQPLHRIDTFCGERQGYQPFISQRGWLVVLLNREPRFDPANVGSVERHNQTDEVFVLTRGHSLLFIFVDETINAIDMQPGVIYNVTSGTWHGILGTEDATWLIVESSDTSTKNSDYRQMNENELGTLRGQFPAWFLKGVLIGGYAPIGGDEIGQEVV